jgi:predicted dithiol-disulfide oxidoreductase (DUF899 family)
VLLAKEKEFTRARDALSAERRALPWVKINKPYVFEGSQGREMLANLLRNYCTATVTFIRPRSVIWSDLAAASDRSITRP